MRCDNGTTQDDENVSKCPVGFPCTHGRRSRTARIRVGADGRRTVARSFRAVHVQTALRAPLRLWQADDRDPLQPPGFHLPRRLLPQAIAVRLAVLAEVVLR